jgi:hypothetical protein
MKPLMRACGIGLMGYGGAGVVFPLAGGRYGGAAATCNNVGGFDQSALVDVRYRRGTRAAKHGTTDVVRFRQ